MNDNIIQTIKKELKSIKFGELTIKIQHGKVYLLEKKVTKKLNKGGD